MSFTKKLRDMWNSAKAGASTQPSSRRKPAGKQAATNFGLFLLLPLPAFNGSKFPTDDDRDSYADAIGDAIHRGLNDAKISGWERVALYLPQQASGELRRIFGTSDQIDRLEKACDRKLFVGPTAARKRVHVINRDLDFHPAFDGLMNGAILVRPLASGDILVSRDNTQTDKDLIQLLIGVLEVSRSGQTLAKQLIWAYRVPTPDPRIRVNVDFDLLAKGFPRENRCYPLGLEINCLFQEQGGARMIEEVSLDFSQALMWLGKVPNLQYVLITGRSGGMSQRFNLRDYGEKQSTLKVNQQPTSGSNVYPLSSGVDVPYNRIQALEVGADDKTLTYTFAFFPTAVSYDPKKNVLRLRAQLIPSSGASVLFAPGIRNRAQTAFTLKPTGAAGAFTLQIPQPIEYTYEKKDREGSVTPVDPAARTNVQLGDEIIAKPNSGEAHHRFRFEELDPVPAEVLAARSTRQYAARVVIEAPVDRCFELSDTEHIFGAGRQFDAGSESISQQALRFTREYLALKVFGAPGQSAFFVPKSSAVSPQTGKQVAKRLPDTGTELDLNADYDLYIGDLQFFLNLTATPSSVLLAGSAGATTWP